MKDTSAELFAWPALAFFGLTPVVMVLSHQAVTFTVLPVALLALILAGRRPALGRLLRPVPAALLGFGLLAFASTLWAPEPHRTAADSAQFLGLVTVLVLFLAAIEEAGPRLRARMKRVLAAAFVVAAILLLVQIAGGFLIKWEVAGKEYGTVGALYKLNVSTAGLIIVLWPVLFLLASGGGVARRAAAGAAVILVAAAAFLGIGLAPKVVLPVAAAAFLVAVWRPRSCAVLVAAGVIAATVAVLVLPGPVYRSDRFTEIQWLDRSSKYRIDIWDLAVRWAHERPVLGYGANASRAIPPLAEKSKTHGRVRRIPLYPHNVMVQTVLELGFVGLALAVGICLLMIRAASRLPPPLPAYALAAFVAAAGIWFIGYPLWRSAWLSWLGFAALTVLLAAPDPPAERECAAS